MKGLKRFNSCWSAWAISLLLCGAETALSADKLPYRVVYCQTGLSLRPNSVYEYMKTSANAGYNGFVTCDWAQENAEEISAAVKGYYQQAQALAKSLNIKFIPWHFYQQNGAHENINLAEAFPVRSTPFVVSGGRARVYSDPAIKLLNGGFETGSPVPEKWKAAGSVPSIDKAIKHSGNASVVYENPVANSALIQMVKNLKPFRAYELSVWIRTQGFSPGSPVKFQVLRGGQTLLNNRDAGFGRWGINGNNGTFTKYKADFNTLNNTSVLVRLMATAGTAAKGKIWFDNAVIREVGLYETMARTGCPIVVKSKDGSKTYVQGTDYSLDPKCKTFTEQSFYYEGHLSIPAGSSIKNGDELKVDWYQLANTETRIPETNWCLAESWSTVQNNLDQIDKLFGNSDAMSCNVNEWRVGAWDPQCASFSFKTAGEYIGQAWAGMECMMRKTGNGCRTILSWSDTFDPYHNACVGYHPMIMGDDLRGTWNYLSHDLFIVNWNGKYAKESMRFFAGLDPKYPNQRNRQLISIADGPGIVPGRIAIAKQIEKDGGEKIVGMQWVNWVGNYSSIVPVANAFKAEGFWGTGPFPIKTCAPLKECAPVGISRTPQSTLPQKHRNGICVTNRAGGQKAIRYRASSGGKTTLKVFDLFGRQVETLVSKHQTIGSHSVTWNTSSLPAGMYILRLSVDGGSDQILRQMVF